MFRDLVGCLSAAVLLVGASAEATPNFPPAVKSELSLSADPACTLCHLGTPMVGTVTQPFGKSLRERGLLFYDVPSLQQALARLEAEAVDSDGDTLPDVEELKAGGDPNFADSENPGGGPPVFRENFGEPHYGCSAAPSSAGAWWGFGLCLLALLRLSSRVSSVRTGAHPGAQHSNARPEPTP